MAEDLITAVLVAVCAFLILRMLLTWRARISSEDAHRRVEEGALLLDVRTSNEVARGSLPDAKNIPVQVLSSRLDELDKERPVIVYCASGMRSARAKAVLEKAGFEAYDLGPLSAW